MPEGVTIEQLRTLRAVVEAGSFSAAARKLGRVQAAVSQAIDRLESQQGLLLFDRSGRVPRLTPAGHAVAQAAARIETGVAALDELVRGLKQGTETELRLIVDVLFPAEALVTFAREFRALHPGVEQVLFTDVLSAVTAHLRERKSAWGIAVEDADLSELERRAIAHVELLPVAAPEHPLAREQRPLGVVDLADAVQIVQGEHGQSGAGQESSPDRGVLSTRRWRVVDLATKLALIRGGLGWGHLPEHVARADLSAGQLVQLQLEAWGNQSLRRALFLVNRPDASLGPVARWAASGIFHEEYHEAEFTRRGGPLHMMQLWVNLPRKDKSAPPGYQALQAAQIPNVALPGGGVVAGELQGARGPSRTFTPVTLLDVRLRAGEPLSVPLPASYNAMVVVASGSVQSGATLAAAGELLLFANDGSTLELTASTDAHLIVLAGEPIAEPIVQYGPFVMNTVAEIRQALLDVQRGKLGPVPDDEVEGG